MLDSLKTLAPWPVRIASKVVLSRLPVDFATWRRLGLFRLGRMNRPDYAWFVFGRLLDEFRVADGLRGRRLLELGPGDGVASGLLASCLGAEWTMLVDAGDFASRDVRDYAPMVAEWERLGLPVDHLRPHVQRGGSFDELCEAGRTTYRTNGLTALRSLPDASIDLEFSNAVLEHVRLDVFDDTLVELRRLLRPSGLGRHAIDFRDHLGGGLNNLRFTRARWESPLFAQSGFYTNRIRCAELLARLSRAGFGVRVLDAHRWPALPLARPKLDAAFRDLDEADLRVWGADVELTRDPAPAESGAAAQPRASAAPLAAPLPSRYAQDSAFSGSLRRTSKAS